jgi:hypothetical protein
VTAAASYCAVRIAPYGGVGWGPGAGLPTGGAGGGAGASFAGEEVAGTMFSGTTLEGEIAAVFFFFSLRTGRTRGSDRPTSSVPTPMLLAPVSSGYGGEMNSSSTRKSGGLGAARPELVFPPRREEGDLPAPEGTGLVGRGGEVLAASS